MTGASTARCRALLLGWVGLSILHVPVRAQPPADQAERPLEEAPVPSYPRVALGEVHRVAARDPMRIASTTNRVPTGSVLVLGRVVHGRTAGMDRDLIVDDLMACCVAHSVGFRLAEGHGLDDGAWLAVYGRFVPVALSSVVARAPWRRDRMISIAGGYELAVEGAVPAERVMYPDNVVDLLDSASLATFRRALRETGLDQRLRAEAGITLLAPVDAAFERMPADVREALFDPDNRGDLARFVLRHVVDEPLSKRQLLDRRSVNMMDASSAGVVNLAGKPVVAGSRYLFGDQRGRNGYLHMIMPALPPAEVPTAPRDPYDPLP